MKHSRFGIASLILSFVSILFHLTWMYVAKESYRPYNTLYDIVWALLAVIGFGTEISGIVLGICGLEPGSKYTYSILGIVLNSLLIVLVLTLYTLMAFLPQGIII